jgi:hypothetical protein
MWDHSGFMAAEQQIPPLSEFVDSVKVVKADGHDWDDLSPTIWLFHQDGSYAYVILNAPPGPVLWTITEEAAAGLGVVGAVMVTDCFMTTDALGEHYQHGDLQEAWRSGNQDGMVETLVIVRVTRADDPETVMLPYDATTRSWGDPVVGGMNGGLLDALAHGLARASARDN